MTVYRAKGEWYRERDKRLFVEPYLAGKPVWQIAHETHYSECMVIAALKAAGAWEGRCPANH